MSKLINIGLNFFLFFQLSYSQDFGYDGNIGPQFWGIKYQGCNGGKLQSPIDIELNNVTEFRFPPLIFEYFDQPLETVKLENNGHTALLSIKQGNIPNIHGGPLNGTYNFSQLHFHWGKSDDEGSENRVNNQSFPLELHIVLFNTGYGNFSNALQYEDGLTVLSFLYHKTIKENKNYQKFEQELPSVEKLTATVDIFNFVSLDNFTTTDRKEYFTYKGSLTTPPCSEIVTWIEFTNTIPLSHGQIEEFRFLSGSTGKLKQNFRPTQARNDRAVYINIPSPRSDTSDNKNVSAAGSSHKKSNNKQNSASAQIRSSFVTNVIVILIYTYYYFTVN